MPRDKTESHKRVIAAAKAEFLEKGFNNASMRSIGARAGMTSAGLYRHYKNKEDMFSALVQPAVEIINKWNKEHKEYQYRKFESGAERNEIFSSNDTDLVRMIIRECKDEFRLILVCSQGTKYENFVHDIVEYQQKETMKAMKYLKEHGMPVKDISEEELHMIYSAYDTAVLQPLAHDWPIEKAEKSLNTIEEFFMPGWRKLMGF